MNGAVDPVVANTGKPFRHTGGENLFGSPIGVRTDCVIKPIQRFARPERLIEPFGFGFGMAILDHLLDNDRPRPEGRSDQHDHHEFYGNRCAEK